MDRLIGKKAPDFTVPAVTGDGEDFIEVSLSDYQGRWLILFFYPLDFTFVCPTEITAFSEAYQAFEDLNARILAVSTDSKYSHQAWIRDGLGEINFPIAADKTAEMSRCYGVLKEDEGIAFRGLFIIDPKQTVRYCVLHDLNVGRNTEEIRRVLNALKTGGLCGAGWKEGEALLEEETVKETAPAEENGAKVKLYTMPDCSYCKKVKKYFAQGNIPYDETDLSTDREGQLFMEQRGYRALPVTVIDGEEIVGYNMKKIKELLGR